MRQMHLHHSPHRELLAACRVTLQGFHAVVAKHLLISLGLLLLLVPAAQAAAPASTRTAVTASQSNGSGTGAETLTANVQTSTGNLVDAGTVDFLLQNGQSVGSAIVGTNGAATLVLHQLPQAGSAGQLTLTGVYHANSASGNFSDSASAPVAIPSATTVTPDFTVTGNPTTVTTPVGSYGTTTITVTSVGGYSGSMEFSCSALPAQVTCAFNPTQQILAANGSFVSTLQLETQAASGEQGSLLHHSGGIAMALAVPGALALLGLARRRRITGALPWLGTLLLLTGAGLGLSGCSQRYGYLHHPPPVATGTPTGTFPITVAVDGGSGASVIEHDLTVNLVVQ